MSDIETRVKKIVAEQLGVAEADIKTESSFVDDLGADSLDTVELVMALEVGSRNITVNCVAPGFIDTDMTRVLPEEQKTKLLERIPLGRLGRSEDIAEAVAYLASERAAYVTGTTLHVNGGMYMN